MQTITPFEKYMSSSKNQIEIANILMATSDIVDVIHECEKQIKDFSNSENPDDIITANQAAIDLVLAEKAILIMAEKLEEEFGISA